MSSLLAWLDTSPAEQKAAREIISYFSDRESRDELGIGQIRDALGDLLFPGTSTLHTRARYFLFIPWCYLARNAQRHHGRSHRETGRKNERKLIETLRNSGTNFDRGIIGGRVGPSIKTLPSSVYWNAMRSYGIRTFSGEIGTLPVDAFDQMDELAARLPSEWDPGIPEVPSNFPYEVPGGMDLSTDEASWLRDRIITAHPHSLLSEFLRECEEISADTSFPWEARAKERFPELNHAFSFSNVMYGAALLYNLAIAEIYEREYPDSEEGYVDEYRQFLEEWQDDFLFPRREEIVDWDRSDFKLRIQQVNPGVSVMTWDFVNRWTNGVLRTSNVADDVNLRQLVRAREARKGKQSRLNNSALRKNWSGASGAGQLAFRWGTVRTLINDVAHGLNGTDGLEDTHARAE